MLPAALCATRPELNGWLANRGEFGVLALNHPLMLALKPSTHLEGLRLVGKEVDVKVAFGESGRVGMEGEPHHIHVFDELVLLLATSLRGLP